MVDDLTIETADRPSRHGRVLGQVLAALAEAGRRELPGMPDPCLTCAFREGSMPNQMASTGMIALNCVMGVDSDRFACHHGMKDGDPKTLCAGYAAAILAPFPTFKAGMEWLAAALAETGGDDLTRAEFDEWVKGVDAAGMDAYQLARLYARRPPAENSAVARQGSGANTSEGNSAPDEPVPTLKEG